ncbi:hypothetical protein OG943_30340 [Amycolatopsis sp. NBC_00345]|uniref:hypothetical protein n=1 Tax=Amycolatopsis sp. NBC_00345 TaxID=2975955 RepID=UPI002E252BA9
MTKIGYRDRFVGERYDDIGRLVADATGDTDSIAERPKELARVNCPPVARCRRLCRDRVGIPDTAFKTDLLYFFPEVGQVKRFSTSGTTGQARGQSLCTPRGLELMTRSVLVNAHENIFRDLDGPAIVRLVPTVREAPEMAIAHHMETISGAFIDPDLSGSVTARSGIDFTFGPVMVAGRLRRRGQRRGSGRDRASPTGLDLQGDLLGDLA